MKQFPNPTAANEYQNILPTGDTLGILKQNENVKQTQHLPGNYYHSNALLNQNGAYESMQNANNSYFIRFHNIFHYRPWHLRAMINGL
jgi:hypothetical protein